VFAVSRLVDELCASLVRFEPGCLSGGECAELAERLARAAKVCETASARAAARAAECGVARDGADASVAEWMARVGGGSSGEARAALETVKAVEACPETRDALFAGEVSLAQAAEIASVLGYEAELLGVARSSGLGRVKDVARTRPTRSCAWSKAAGTARRSRPTW
jgi:cell pole-organizing protein PopZ